MTITESPLATIKRLCQEILKFNEDDKVVVDVYTSVLTAAYHSNIPEFVWMYIVGPPGCGKTELVCLMIHHEGCEFIDDLTEHALTSGYSDETGFDPSLLNKLNGKVLVIKDLGDFAENNPRLVDKIWGELRAIFDKYYVKASGVVGTREYNVRFGIVAAATEYIDKFSERHRQLGERFLSFRLARTPLTLGERREFNKRCVALMNDKDSWQQKLRGAVQKEVDRIMERCRRKDRLPEISAEALEVLLGLADLLCLFRTIPIEGTAMQPEFASRVVQQLVGLVQAHAFADDRDLIDESDLALARRVVIDSLSVVRRRMIHWMYLRGAHRLGVSKEQIASTCGTTPIIVWPILVQYLHSKVIELTSVSEKEEAIELYRLTPEIYKIVKDCGLLEGTHMTGLT